MTKLLARNGGEGARAANNAVVLGCLLLIGDAPARPTTVTLGAFRNWLGGGRGMSPSAAAEPQSCLMACLFCTVSVIM